MSAKTLTLTTAALLVAVVILQVTSTQGGIVKREYNDADNDAELSLKEKRFFHHIKNFLGSLFGDMKKRQAGGDDNGSNNGNGNEEELSLRKKRFFHHIKNFFSGLFGDNEEDMDSDMRKRQADVDNQETETFDLLDRNKDGVIEYNEGLAVLEKAREKRQVNEQDVASYTAGFDSLDKNGDGVIEPFEISA